jgi:hypothetical protein
MNLYALSFSLKSEFSESSPVELRRNGEVLYSGTFALARQIIS